MKFTNTTRKYLGDFMQSSKENDKKALKAGGWYIFSNFLIKGIQFLTIPIITRLLTPEEFGIGSTYKSSLLVLVIITTLNSQGNILIAKSDIDEEDYNSYISSIMTLTTILVLIFYFISKIFSQTFVQLTGIPSVLLEFAFLDVLFTTAFKILQTKYRAKYQYKSFVIISLLNAIFSPLISILFIYLMDNKAFGYIIGSQSPIMFLGLLMLIYIMVKGNRFINKEYWKFGLSISLPLVPHALSNNLLSQFDKVLINFFTGPTSVGFYSIGYSYSAVLSTIWTSFNQAWTPWFFDSMREKNYNGIKNFTKPYLVIFSLIFISILVITPEAIQIFATSEYSNGVWVVPPILLGLYFQFIYGLYVNIEIFYKKTYYMSIGTIFAAVINLVLNIIFIPLLGFIAAAYTTLASYVVLAIIHYIIANRLIDIDLFGEKFIFIWSGSIILVTIIVTLLFNNIFLRYSFYLLYVILIMLRFRKPLSRIVKETKIFNK